MKWTEREITIVKASQTGTTQLNVAFDVLKLGTATKETRKSL